MITVIRVNPGQEVIETLNREAARLGIASATLNVIGAVNVCRFSTMPVDDETRNNHFRYDEALEMLGVGEITDGKAHVHASFYRSDGTVVGGHVQHAWVGRWFVRIYASWENHVQ